MVMADQNTFVIKSAVAVFGGTLFRFSAYSKSTKCQMTAAVYIPCSPVPETFPYLLYLSGLTCTDENVCQKSGIFRSLSAKKIAFVAPDTSPRGLNIPGDDASWDFGVGAGFYVNATQTPWTENYHMYSYIVDELPILLSERFPQLDQNRVSIMGHSMGGHGALTIALRNPSRFKSVSAFAPICNPSRCPWGRKALGGYLGSDEAAWADYDATILVSKTGAVFDKILIDVGKADPFLSGQLLPEVFRSACEASGQPLELRYQESYDHSYYFISTFIDDHVAFHAERM